MVIAAFSDFVGPAILLWLVLMFVAIVAGWFKPRLKHRASAGKHQPIEVELLPIEVEHQATEVDHQAIEVEHQAAMRDFGAIERTGDELRHGWFEHIFVLEKPVAGVDEVWTLHGFARFTTANRCIVISDGQRLVILDREKDHGLRLVISTVHWFDWSVEENTVVLSCHKRHGSSELLQRFVIETHTDHNSTLVPEGWRWESTLLPESRESDSEDSST